MRLSPEIVDFIGLDLGDDSRQVGGVGEVSVMELEAGFFDVWVLVNMIHPFSVEQGGPPFDAVNFISLLEQKLGEVGTILSGDTGDQCFFHDVVSLFCPSSSHPSEDPIANSRGPQLDPSGSQVPEGIGEKLWLVLCPI